MKDQFVNMYKGTMEHAHLAASTVKDGTLSALHDTKIHYTVGFSTIFAGMTASDVAVWVGILLSTLLAIKTFFDIRFKIKQERRDETRAILEDEIKRSKERDRKKAVEDAEKSGHQPRRNSDIN